MRIILLLFFLFSLSTSPAQIITTVAGNGTNGYSGDGGAATSAQLGDLSFTYPAFDNAGNMYFGQSFNNTIRKVDANGIITTIAGTPGLLGYTGDGGPAVNALIYHPTSIAVDNSNNIIFGDANGDFFRKISPAGIINTISGQATVICGYGDGGLLINARFLATSGLTIDNSGNLYIADYGCNTIRKVSTTGIITTIAGNGTIGYSGDGGIATNAQLAYPCKVAVDNAGNVFIADAQNHRIRKVSTSGIITTIAGTGVAGYTGDGGLAVNAQIGFPGSVVIDNSGNIYFGDNYNVIRKITPAGIISTYAGTGVQGYTGDGGPAALANINMTEGRISIDNNNNIYFDDERNNVIRKITSCLTATITQQPSDSSLCNNGNAVFSLTVNNATSLQWEENKGAGWNALTDNSTYAGTSGNSLSITNANTSMNGFQYRCKTTNSCGNLYSNTVTLFVKTPASPALSILASANSICAGTNTQFTASSTNAGTTPVYQWKKNGINVGADNPVYNDNALISGDIISCGLTSNASCLTTNTAVSNSITMIVNSPVAPSISIASSLNNSCFGTPVTFNSVSSNPGSNPIYQWKKNGIDVGTNIPTYTDNALNNGDIISCTLTSGQSCITTATANSNAIVMAVKPLITPAVTINTLNAAICNGKPATFNATPVNAGSSPVYQWQKNGINVGINSNVYNGNNFVNGDIISCMLTSNSSCLAVNPVRSNTIALTVFQNPVVSLEKNNTLCSGSSRTLDAGNFKSYLWNDGSTNRNLKIIALGTYYVTVTDNNGCVAGDTVKINTLLPKPNNFLPKDTAICSYGSIIINAKRGYSDYLWNDNSTQPGLTVTKPGLYWLQVKDMNSCTGKDSILVIPKQCLEGFFIPTAFSPNNDGKNDFFKPMLFGNLKKYRFIIYNRWGQTVFETSDVNTGWDGNYKGVNQNGNAFVWICNFQFANEQEEVKKGTVVLVR